MNYIGSKFSLLKFLEDSINETLAKNNETKQNMKFLESVTKIYERSGRGDLANGLKNSISKAKQTI